MPGMCEQHPDLSCSHCPSSSRKPRRLSRTMRSVIIKPSAFLALALVMSGQIWTLAAAQSVEIQKTIKEELSPDAVVAELMAEPAFASVLESARRAVSGTPGAAAAAGSNNSLHFSVLTSGNSHAEYFVVDQKTGVVSIKKRIDREMVCSFRDQCVLDFEVAARSVLGSFFRLVQFVVTITDINDNSPEFAEPTFELFVPEESDAGRRFTLPTAFDRDTGFGNGVSEYRVLQGPPMFELDTQETDINTTAVFLVLNSVVNREKSESYKILIGAVDGGLPPLTGTLTVQVQISDINDNFPVFEKSVYSTTIPEDFGRDHPVQTISATDADAGANGELMYAFSAQQPLENLHFFRMDSSTGSIYLSRSIESLTGQQVELVVEARDKGHPPKVTKAKVEVFVEDTVNSMPTIIADALGGAGGVAEVSEYAKPGKVVAHVSVMDPDSGPNGKTLCKLDTREFELEKLGDGGGKFTAVLKAELDRETTDFYEVTVECTDSGVPALMATEQFSVRVLDENDLDPVFDPRAYEVDIQENNTIGEFITQLSATDGDIGINAELTYDVAGINHKYFAVDPSGRMTALVPLDREDSGRVVVTVIATDGGKPPRSATATVVVNLLDTNDCRPKFERDVFEYQVEEGRPAGKFVGIVSASDEDVGNNQEVFYHFPAEEFISAASQGAYRLFRVDEDGGIISTAAILDREDTAVHTLLVLATDKGSPPLTGTATVVVRVLDINDNDPVFEFPLVTANSGWENESVSIPHTWDPAEPIVTVVASDKDEGLNAEIVYTLSSINASAPFSVNPSTGAVTLDEELSPDDVGLYFMTVAANDQGPKQQRATQAPLYIDVFFDNSTLLLGAGNTRGPSQGMVLGLVIGALVVVLTGLLCVVFVCVRRSRAHQKLSGGMPNSASTCSTAKLHGGYYIAPGVRGSSDSILASKHSQHTDNNFNTAVSQAGEISPNTPLTNSTDDADGMRSTNSYVMMRPADQVVPSEIIEISRTNGHTPALNDTADPDNPEDGTMFSTFKSEEDILSPEYRSGSLRRQSNDASSIAKRSGTNDTFDEMSNDDSTSDSGRGGSEVDINGGAAAAAAAASKEKARALAATPVSVKSGISNRLSPLPQGLDPDYGQRTFVTFRGDSPSSFRFDSDNDTLTRRRGRIPPSPGIPLTPSQLQPDGEDDAESSSTLAAPPSRRFDFSVLPRRLSESDGTDSELGAVAAAAPPRGRFQNMRRPFFPPSSLSNSSAPQYPHPQHIAGIFSANTPGAPHTSGYSSGGEGGPHSTSSFLPSRQLSRVPPLLPMFMPPPSYQPRPESESDAQLSDSSGSTNPAGRYRNNHVPRLPYYPGIEFSHHAYGGSNRNSIGAFSNHSALSNMEPPYHYYQDQNNPTSASSFAPDHQLRRRGPSSSSYNSDDPVQRGGPDARVSVNYGNVVSELQESRPVSMEADFLLPPYPEVDSPEADRRNDDQLHVHSGYTGFSPYTESEREALFSNSKLESSA